MNPLPLVSNSFELYYTADLILFGCKTWRVTLKTECRMRPRVFDTGVLRGMIGPERE